MTIHFEALWSYCSFETPLDLKDQLKNTIWMYNHLLFLLKHKFVQQTFLLPLRISTQIPHTC